MKKIKYYYNTHTLRYEKLVIPLRVKLLRILGFIAAAIVTALIIVLSLSGSSIPPKRKSFACNMTGPSRPGDYWCKGKRS
jgi:hypothetical protein